MADAHDPHLSASHDYETEYHCDDKAYHAGGDAYSIKELLLSATAEEYMANNMPRISDFHIKIGQPIRYRLDDELVTIPQGEPVTPETFERLVFPLLTADRLEQLRKYPLRDVDAGWQMPDEDFNFRINIFRDRDGMAAVVRLLPPQVPDVSDLGFPNDAVWKSVCERKQGLVLLTGITGSGKSTSIASLLNHINNTRPLRVITLEDPIEYVFDSRECLISQREVGTHAESFGSGLYGILRENPDVIFVGEMRNQETAALALTAAETGHLVFSTLHTRDALGAVTRIIDMFPPERSRELSVQLSFSLAYIISQKLVPAASGEGRVLAMEVLRNASGVGNLIRTGKWPQLYSIMETRGADGMITMEQSLMNLVSEGRVTKADAIAHANDPTVIERR